MLRFLGYVFLGFIAQIFFLVAYVGIHIAFATGDIAVLDEVVAYAYLWPLMLIPPNGGSHGGELFFSPVAAILYAVFLALLLKAWKRSSLK